LQLKKYLFFFRSTKDLSSKGGVKNSNVLFSFFIFITCAAKAVAVETIEDAATRSPSPTQKTKLLQKYRCFFVSLYFLLVK